MKPKKIIGSIFVVLTVGICISLVYWYNNTTHSTHIQTSIDAKNLGLIFQENEKVAVQRYRNAVVRVSGIVKKISFLNNVNTLILLGKSEGTNIICEMNAKVTKEQLPNKNDTILLQGTCKGFLKDVILLNCQIIKE